MATINKQSVRDEFDKIKASFEQLEKSGKVPAETAALFNAMILLFNIILSVFMEKLTKKTSANSSIPPSQSNADETTINATKKKKNGNVDKNKEATTIGRA